MTIRKTHNDHIGCLLWIVVITLIFLLSCSKVVENNYTYDKYELVIDWYDLDTTLVKRTIWWTGSEDMSQEPDRWELICEPLHIDHSYYLKNGKKIQPSAYPKNDK